MTEQTQPAESASAPSSPVWLVAALIFPTIVTWLYFVALAGMQPTSQIVYSVGKTIQFALPVIWLLVIARESIKRPKLASSGYVEGALFGLASAAAMLAIYELAFRGHDWFAPVESEVKDKINELSLQTLPRFLSLSIFYAALHSLMEEYYWRWFVFRRLMVDWKTGPAILVSSLGFMAHHVILLAQYFGTTGLFTYIGSAGVAIGGAYWAWLYSRKNSIGPAWLGHAIIDAVIFVIGYRIVFG